MNSLPVFCVSSYFLPLTRMHEQGLGYVIGAGVHFYICSYMYVCMYICM